MIARALTSNECGLLALALASIADSRCRASLLDQMQAARAVDVLPGAIDIEVPPPTGRGCLPGWNSPIEGTVRNLDGEVVGGILVWILDGAVRSLECYSYLDGGCTEFPDPSLVSIDPPRDIPRP